MATQIESPTESSQTDPVRICRIPSTEEKLARILGGSVTLLGLGLGFFVSPWWYLLSAFAGLQLLQSAFTGFCPPEIIYRVLNRSSHGAPGR
jgi:hypothetical protein